MPLLNPFVPKPEGCPVRAFHRPVLSLPKPHALGPHLLATLLLLLGVHAPLPGGGWAEASVDGVVELRSADDQAVRFVVRAPEPRISAPGAGEDASVTAPGFEPLDDLPGAPELPAHSVLIAIPPGMEPVLSITPRGVRTIPAVWPRPVPKRALEEGPDEVPYEISTRIRDNALYAATYPAAWGSLGKPSTLRHVRVVAVSLQPYRWSPRVRGLEVASELEVEVRFVATPGRGQDLGVSVPRDVRWERIYASRLLNGALAPAYARGKADLGQRTLRRSAPHGEWRIGVEQTRIHRVTYQGLAAAGFSETPPIAQVALNERRYNPANEVDPLEESAVPIVLRDVNANGLFDSGDDFLFLGQSAWDRLDTPARWKRYGRSNSYFFSVRPEGGARMARVSSDLGRSDLTPEASALWTESIEGDGVYMKFAANDEPAGNLALGIQAIRQEHFYWIGEGGGTTYQREFNLPGFVSARAARLALQSTRGGSLGTPTIALGPTNGETVPLQTEFDVPPLQRRVFDFDAAALDTIPLRAAGNRVQFTLDTGEFGASLDWMRFTYDRNLVATGDAISFATAEAQFGPREFRLTGFSAPGATTGLIAFDLSDSLAPKELTYEAAQLLDSGRGLKLQLDLTAPRVLSVLRPGAAAAPVTIVREAVEDLAVDGDEDVIVVIHPDFRAGFTPWVEAREAEGFRVKVVSIRDLYDQFNGGRPWPEAIRNYLRWLWRARSVDPSYLVLVGDASDDFANTLKGQNSPSDRSAPNFVPTQTLFSNAFSSAPELVASDHWFVDNLNDDTEQLDFAPDMHVGRLPVGNTTELGALVTKILEYGQFGANDTWRNRGLVVSDDEYSNRISFNGAYTWHGDADRNNPRDDEAVFIYSGRRTCEIIREEAGFSDFECDSFFVADYMDSVACLGRCEPDSNGSSDCRDWTCPWVNDDLPADRRVRGQICYFGEDCPGSCGAICDNQEYGNTVVSEKLIQAMGRGHLFVSYNGHANGHLCAHEYVLQDDGQFGRFDADRMGNVGKPFVFFGFGCHLAEFSRYLEGAPLRGDSMAERFLFQRDGRGAIGVIASTAYEWLSENATFNLALMDSWFTTPPTDENGDTVWRLGDVYSAGKLALIATGGRNNQGMITTYALLGDPTLTLDLAPPRLREVRVNGEEWEPGASIVSEAESDSARIEVLLVDEVMIESATVVDRDGPVDPSRFRFLPDPESPNDDRRRVLSYSSLLVPTADPYVVRIEASDRTGRVREVEFPVAVENKLFGLEGGSYREILPNDFLAAGDSIRIELRSPVRLRSSQLAVTLDSEGAIAATFDPEDASPEGSRVWLVRARIPGGLTAGEHTIRLRITRSHDGGTTERSMAFLGVSGEVSLLQAFNFPNPFAESTAFHYTLDGGVQSAQVTIFSLRGRKIATLTGSTLRGENVLPWDGRDQDGDRVANGVYFYKLRIETFDGRTLERTDRLARVR